MKTIYLKTLGKLTIMNESENGVVFKEIPEKTFCYSYIEYNKISQEEYNQIKMTTSELKQAIENRGIRYIYHFTSVNNLVSILKKGFIPRCFLTDKKMRNNFLEDFINSTSSELNDYYRFDCLPEATNFSISCINLYLLKEYQKRFKDRTYCVLKLNKELILHMYNKGEYFFYHNASSNMFFGNKSKYRMGQSFNKMFYDNLSIVTDSYHGIMTREMEGRFTTSLQADLMINGFLSAKNIVEIIFRTEEERQNFLNYILTDCNLRERVRPITKVDSKVFEVQRYEA